MKKRFTISVKQQHIDDAKSAALWIKDQCKTCPIALALYEQMTGGKYKLKRRMGWGNDVKEIEFGKYQPFSVAKDIEWIGIGIVGQERTKPPQYIPHTKESKEFIIRFDKEEQVSPFTFEIELDV